LLCLLALALVAPQLRSGAEMVRARNALALGPDITAASLDWRPPAYPDDYRVETAPPSPYFLALVQQLGLDALPDDWARTVAIARHLLGSAPALKGHAIKQGLQETHRRIVEQGDGYCGDFVRVFTAIANAAGMEVRPWAFSFDGFGGHGHIWMGVWNRQTGTWHLADVFNNQYFTLDDGPPLSTLQVRAALLNADPRLVVRTLAAELPPAWEDEAKYLDYLRRGLDAWYLPWGHNVMSMEAVTAIRGAGFISRTLENAMALALGAQPSVRMLALESNQAQRQAMRSLRTRLHAAAALLLAGGLLWVWPARRPPISVTAPAHPRLPGVVVYSNLFPSSRQPGAGLFIRERMFRLRDAAPLVVVSPQPWFPGQGLVRLLRPGYRPETPAAEVQQGVTVLFPRFLALPGVGRALDGLSMAVCTWPLMRRLRDRHGVGLIDAHFAYPSGSAAVRLGRWLGLPSCVTLRGTELRHMAVPALRAQVLAAVNGATHVISVSDSLRRVMMDAGVDGSRIEVIGNGVDLARFRRLPRATARARLGLPPDAPVLVSVGGLVERKGFHRVIALLPALSARFPGLRYLVVGGPSPEGDMEARLRAQVQALGLQAQVVFTGPLPPEALSVPLSAADVFVLATANEGWANVFLEAMACGLPVVTTAVGGNREVVCSPEVGTVVPFGDESALAQALTEALQRPWDRERIVAYAQANTWDERVQRLQRSFARVSGAAA
jgi:glycosyltransferase involved in cell wall biosynthesis